MTHPFEQELLELPFDQYQRYRLIQEAIDVLRWESPLRVLDVGGSPGTLKRFLPDDHVIVADIADQGGLDIYANGLRLPFKDRGFDAAVSSDTLEHIPPEHRNPFVSELARVSNEAVIIGAPFDDPAVNQAEEVLHNLILERYGEGHHFLEEHRCLGLPRLEDTDERLEELGFHTAVLPNGYLHRWLLALSTFFLLQWRLHDKALSARANTYYNDNFYRADMREPSYRKVIVAARTREVDGLKERLCVADPEDRSADREIHYRTLEMFTRTLTESWSEQALKMETAYVEKTRELNAVIGTWPWKLSRVYAKTLGAESPIRRVIRGLFNSGPGVSPPEPPGDHRDST